MIMDQEYEVVSESSLLYTIVFTVIFICAIATNILLLLIYIRNPVLITASHLLHINLACGHVLLALFSMSFGVVTNISGKWIFPDFVCHLVGFFNSLFIQMTLFTAFSLLNERYHFKMNQRRHALLYTTKRVSVTVGVFWGLSALISAAPFVPQLGQYHYHTNLGTCWHPISLLNLVPAAVNTTYIILWLFLVYNLLTLPKIKVPHSLKAKRADTRFLPQLLTSSVYTVAALVSVTFTVLQKLDLLYAAAVPLERTSLMLTYSTTILLPLFTILWNADLRSGCLDVLRRRRSYDHKYKEIIPRQFSQNLLHESPAPNHVNLERARYLHQMKCSTLVPQTRKTPNSTVASIKSSTLPPVRQYQRAAAVPVHVLPGQQTAADHHHPDQIEMSNMQDKPGKCSPVSTSEASSSNSTVGEIVDL